MSSRRLKHCCRAEAEFGTRSIWAPFARRRLGCCACPKGFRCVPCPLEVFTASHGSPHVGRHRHLWRLPATVERWARQKRIGHQVWPGKTCARAGTGPLSTLTNPTIQHQFVRPGRPRLVLYRHRTSQASRRAIELYTVRLKARAECCSSLHTYRMQMISQCGAAARTYARTHVRHRERGVADLNPCSEASTPDRACFRLRDPGTVLGDARPGPPGVGVNYWANGIGRTWQASIDPLPNASRGSRCSTRCPPEEMKMGLRRSSPLRGRLVAATAASSTERPTPPRVGWDVLIGVEAARTNGPSACFPDASRGW